MTAVTTSLEAPARPTVQVARFLQRYGLACILAVICAGCAFANRDFGSFSNLANIWQNASIAAIMFLGLTAVIASGEIDVSFMEIAALSSVLFAWFLHRQIDPGTAALLAVGCGLSFGLCNGLLVGILSFPSLIVTIATGGLAHALAFIVGAGQPIYINTSGSIGYFVGAAIAGVPLIGLLSLLLYICAWFVQDRLVIGHRIYAMAQNRKALEEAGIGCKGIVFSLYIFSGLTAAVAGVLLAASLKSGQPTIGASFFLDGLTAVLLGTTVIKLGKPNVIGTAIGLALLAVLLNILALTGWPNYAREILKGVLLLAGVSVALLVSRADTRSQMPVHASTPRARSRQSRDREDGAGKRRA